MRAMAAMVGLVVSVLFALLDDYSRYVVGYRWGHGEDTPGMQAVLHKRGQNPRLSAKTEL